MDGRLRMDLHSSDARLVAVLASKTPNHRHWGREGIFFHRFSFSTLRLRIEPLNSSGVGIFFLGCGVSVYHGLSGLLHPHEIEHYLVGMSVLGSAFAIEGYSLYIALAECRCESSPFRFDAQLSSSTAR